jgi:hypothetical protein
MASPDSSMDEGVRTLFSSLPVCAGGGLFSAKSPGRDCGFPGTTKQAADRGLILSELPKDIPQGLKARLILRQLRHD